MQPVPLNREVKMKDDEFIVSKTDLKGRITYCNRTFIAMSGYAEHELLGKPHNLVRHPDMPKVIFKLLWERIQQKEEIFAYVKNLVKDGSFYWVYANVTASVDDKGAIIGYYSVRRKPESKAVVAVSRLYRELIDKERSGGVAASQAYLNEVLKEKGVGYDEFIISLQH
jgi:PAS domain S-box-containing protein